jgi:hypothetical protein
MVTINVKHGAVTWNSATGTFSMYESDMRDIGLGNAVWQKQTIALFNPETGTTVRANYVSADSDGEDIAGWNYRGFNRANGKSFRVLVIND